MLCNADEEEEVCQPKRGRGSVRGRCRGRGHGRKTRGSRGIRSRGRGSNAAASTSRDLTTDDDDLSWVDTDAAPQQHSFEGDPGVKATADWTDPYAVFRIFFTSFLLQLVVRETNRYAEEMASQTKTVWSAVSDDDIMCFVALTLLMDIVNSVLSESQQSPHTGQQMHLRPPHISGL